ncbi:thioredoxin domain-containing protein [Fluviicola sp.]|jgi:thiol:disulfide interchange protein|uniref:thioredoxin family protein n=1 Tax=Fluviicola sp. TaxID=1917219 RepID=UPI0028250CE1|nr:thioredoxin domain-containing protein [Fluviicola sp.]MDR0801792.1 thioredoxin family protein [Fluviicola sp.]
MKIPILFLLGLSALFFSFGSSRPEAISAVSGIKFSRLPFEKAVKQAKVSGKLMFIDVHTSWCGPCKEMDKTTFSDSQVGDEFNRRFINLKIDAETDKDGPMISKAYTVAGYPTLLFINGEGKLVKKLVGKQSKEKLLAAIAGIK